MKLVLGLRAGHSDNCEGAVGIVNEHNQMKAFYHHVKRVMENYGHTVIDCNSNASTEMGELGEGVRKGNQAGNLSLFVSLHMNCYNGQAHGVEALTVCDNSRANPYAERLCRNFAELGFFNRGLKFANDYEMRCVQAPNIIFEICFCDSAVDMEVYNRYSWEKLAHTFCNALDSSIPKEPTSVITPNQTSTPSVNSDVIKGKVTARVGLNVRNNQNTSEVIGCLDCGTIVTIDKQYSTKEYWSIRFGNNGGFVSKKFIEII